MSSPLPRPSLLLPVFGKIPPFEVTRGLIIACNALAIPTTLFRLGHRLHTRRLWWDDFWALISLISAIVLVTVFFAIPTVWLDRRPRSIQFFSRWATLFSYTCALWAARLTVAVTIVRLLNPGKLRRLAVAASYAFGVMWAVMVLQKIFFCGKKWNKVPRCPIPRYAGIIELVTDNLADFWLILGPAYMLWKMKLRRAYHILILTIFLCGIFTLISSIAHSVFILLNWPTWIGLSGHIQVAVSIIVSNLLVLVTYVYRVFWGGTTPDSSSDDEANRPTHSRRRESLSALTSGTSTVPSALTMTTLISSVWTTGEGTDPSSRTQNPQRH